MEKTEIDVEYVRRLEERLHQLRNPNHQPKPKEILSDLKDWRERRLYELITGRDQCFEDNFVDIPISASYLQRKVAPQTVAINKQELVKLVTADMLQKTVADTTKPEQRIQRTSRKAEPKSKEKTD
ncbi:hypothetical protein Tcan_04517 [Toxocara canis]|uniref:Uncharacterized protein n=1 Tax=Toxocara canis TaxID=6265 RepID=A0A0B2V5N5_TOXCA|nr:hypothetical protein Tcan_04517 [Toxocara canis]